MAIYDEPEYNLADANMKGWAFTHRDNYISPVTAAEKEGVIINDRHVAVIANTGIKIDVPVDLSHYSIIPNKKFQKAFLKKDGKSIACYMVSGKDPKGVRSVYFTYDDFIGSEDFKQLKKEIDDAAKRFRDKHIAYLKSELAKSHAPSAKKAAKELPVLLKDGTAADAMAWFVANDFDVHGMHESDFKNFVDIVKKSGHVPASFDISRQNDKWGHQHGISAEIDFASKKIVKHGFSTDD